MHWLAVTKYTVLSPLGLKALSYMELLQELTSHPPGLGEVLCRLLVSCAFFITAESTSISNCLPHFTLLVFLGECDIPSTWYRVDTVEVCGMNVYVNVCLITDCVVGPG